MIRIMLCDDESAYLTRPSSIYIWSQTHNIRDIINARAAVDSLHHMLTYNHN